MRLAILAFAWLAVSPVAHADNKEQKERKPCVCAPPKSPTPTLLLEVRWHQGTSRRVSKVFSTGMWTRETVAYSGESHTSGGKLTSAFLDELKTGLKSARWKAGKPPADCDENSDATDFYVGGRKRFTQRSCAGVLEQTTHDLLDQLDRRIEFSPPIMPDEEI